MLTAIYSDVKAYFLDPGFGQDNLSKDRDGAFDSSWGNRLNVGIGSGPSSDASLAQGDSGGTDGAAGSLREGRRR